MQDLTGMGESSRSDATAVLDNCAERSLGVMCQKFIMLFLISSKVYGIYLLHIKRILFTPKCIDVSMKHARSRVLNHLLDLGLLVCGLHPLPCIQKRTN
jgi:hypothetical protein